MGDQGHLRWLLGLSRSPVGVQTAAANWARFALERASSTCQWWAERPLAASAVWSVWLALLYFALGPYSYVKVPDCGNGTLPARMVIAERLLAGEFGYWMDFSGCGTDRVVNNFRLEPHCILLALLPGWLGYGLIMLLQRFVASYFLCRLLRDDLRLEGQAAMLAAMAFSLFNQEGIHWQWDGFTLYDGLGIPSLPLLFWLTNRLTTARSWKALPLGLAVGAMLALSAPYFQTLFFPFLALFWYSLVQPGWSVKRLAVLTSIFLGWAALTFPEMLAAARYVPLSHRTEIVVGTDSPYVKFIENVQFWPKTVWRDNQVVVIVGLVGLLFSGFRDKRAAFTFAAVLGILGFVSHYYYFYDHVFSKLGWVSSFHFHRFIYLVPFLCATTLGLGLGVLPRTTQVIVESGRSPVKIPLGVLLPTLAWLAILYVSFDGNCQRWRRIWRGENFTALYRHPDLLALAELHKEDPDFRVAAISDLWRPKLGMQESHLWTISPGVLWAYGFETTDGYEVLYSLRHKQYWSEVLYSLFTIDPGRHAQHEYWGNMLFLWAPSDGEACATFEQCYDLNLLSLANTKYIVSPYPLNDPDLRLLPSIDPRHFDRPEPEKGLAQIKHAVQGQWGHRSMYIYENRRCLPRAFLASGVQLYDDPQTLRFDLRHKPLSWLRESVMICRRDVADPTQLESLADDRYATCDGNSGQVVIAERTSDRVVCEIEAEQPCVLFLSQDWHPGWKATLDGSSTPILPADHAFQAVHVPSAGKHRVVFTYQASYAPPLSAAHD
jgi:hypothetical protein